MYGWHMGGIGALNMIISLLVLLGVSTAIGFALGLAWARVRPSVGPPPASPEETARLRLARGEITPEQYAALTAALRSR